MTSGIHADQRLHHRSSRALWWTAAATSTALLIVVLIQVDWATVREIIAGVTMSMLLLVLLGLGLEGVFTALRIRCLATGDARLSDSMIVTAWYVFMLVALPARLGEVAAVGLMRRHLGMRVGQAATSLVLQRLLDLAVLSSVLLVLLVIHATPLASPLLFGMLGTLLLSLLVLGLRLHVPLGWASRWLLRGDRRRSRTIRTLLRLTLSARVYHRHQLTLPLITLSTMFTLGKWSCHLAAFALLFHTLALPLSTASGVLLGAGYNCLAVIPLQTIGGFGITEAGLLGLLTLFDVPVELAASATILARVVLVAAPVLFWALVVCLVRGSRSGNGLSSESR